MRSDLSDDEVTQLRELAKRRLRQRLKAVRQALPLEAAALRSAALRERLLELPALRSAQNVGLFWPIVERREVDLRPLDAALRERGAAVFYPFMKPSTSGGTRTGFSRVADVAELAPSGRSFAEPPASAPEAARGELDVLVVPALGADPRGHRLGYGSGFYDVTIPDFRPPARIIVVVFDFQLVPDLPNAVHDVPADIVVTDTRVLHVMG